MVEGARLQQNCEGVLRPPYDSIFTKGGHWELLRSFAGGHDVSQINEANVDGWACRGHVGWTYMTNGFAFVLMNASLFAFFELPWGHRSLHRPAVATHCLGEHDEEEVDDFRAGYM